jgi:hypothetical protein
VSTPRFHDSMRLVSTRTTITCAGLFVVSTLMKWGARTILRSAVVENEKLVTVAVNATGIPEERMYWTELTRHLSTSPYSFMALLRAFASSRTAELSKPPGHASNRLTALAEWQRSG